MQGMVFHNHIDAASRQKSLWEYAIRIIEEVITMQVCELFLTFNSVGKSSYDI